MTLGAYPDFAWSRSRQRDLDRCARRYYWRVYGSWKGWEEDASRSARLAYRLKQLTSLDMAFGQAVHRRAFELVEAARSRRDPPGVEALRQRTRSELAEVYRAQRPDFVDDPKGRPMLRASYYGEGPDESSLQRLREKLDTCLPHLRALDLWERIREREVQVLYVEDPDGEFRPPQVEVDGDDVYARPDLVLRGGADDTVELVEWKTGSPRDDDPEQLALQGLWVRTTLGTDRCRGTIHYLQDGSTRAVEIGTERLEAYEDRIVRGLQRMRSLVADPAVNRPRDRSAFALADDRWACRRCPFFELCEEELRETGGLPWDR